MPLPLTLIVLIAGFVLLIKGADWLVNGASSFAQRFGLSDLMIGLTIVSFGTSAPELLVNIVASFRDSADIAIGNIVGSNISNTLLILGSVSIITPLAIRASTVRKEIPLSLLAAFVLLVMANDHLVDGYPIAELGRGDGMVFLSFFVIFLYYTFGIQRNMKNEEKFTKAKIGILHAIFLIILGSICLALGGEFVVDGARDLALEFGLSEALIGLTIVAVGTSLPELSASMVAALKGSPDISIGNIIGSNIFNIFWILGISAVIKPLKFAPEMNIDLLVVLGSTILLFFLIHNGRPYHRILLFWKQKKDFIIHRWEGVILLASYITYISFVVWRG